MNDHTHRYPCILRNVQITGEVVVFDLTELPGYIPHLNTCVSHSSTGLLSPTHESSSTCNLIKTHCPFLYFEETSLSTWLSTVTISTYLTLSYSNIFGFICGQCHIIMSFLHCFVTTLNYEQLRMLIYSYRLWTAWEVCGAIYCHKEAKQSPRSNIRSTPVIGQESEKKQALRETHSCGAHDGTLQEIRLHTLSQVLYVLIWIPSVLNH